VSEMFKRDLLGFDSDGGLILGPDSVAVTGLNYEASVESLMIKKLKRYPPDSEIGSELRKHDWWAKKVAAKHNL